MLRSISPILMLQFWLALLFCMFPGQTALAFGQNKASLHLVKAQSANANVQADLVTQELRYHIPRASEVYLVWGINGWQAVPEAIRPPETYLDDKKVMRTHLVRKGDIFTTTLRVPRGSRLDYSFMIARKGAGATDVWQNESDYDYRPFTKDVQSDGRIEIESKTQSANANVQADLVTQELRYHIPRASEVYLVWGINGWQAVPEAIRPPETYLDDKKVMRTHLVRKGDIFTTTLRVPRGSRLDYSFMIARKGAGATDVWQNESDYNYRPFTKDVKVDGRIEIESGLTATLAVTAEQRKAWFAGETVDIPLVTEEILYHAPGVGEAWLVWGLEGWQAIPDKTRPQDTNLRDGLMHTRMIKKNESFFALVRAPAGSTSLTIDFSLRRRMRALLSTSGKTRLVDHT